MGRVIPKRLSIVKLTAEQLDKIHDSNSIQEIDISAKKGTLNNVLIDMEDGTSILIWVSTLGGVYRYDNKYLSKIIGDDDGQDTGKRKVGKKKVGKRKPTEGAQGTQAGGEQGQSDGGNKEAEKQKEEQGGTDIKENTESR